MQEDLHICEIFRNFVGFLLCAYIYIRSARTRKSTSGTIERTETTMSLGFYNPKILITPHNEHINLNTKIQCTAQQIDRKRLIFLIEDPLRCKNI